MDIQTLFYVGIIVPTIVTILVFSGFLICWFKCNLRRKQNAVSKHSRTLSGSSRQRLTGSIRYKSKGKYDSRSQQSNDSAIDVGELDLGFEDSEKAKNEVVVDSKTLKKIPGHSYENELVVTEAQVHTVDLEKGSYPSIHKLRVELRSQAKIYESVEEAQMIALSLANFDVDQPTNAEKTDLIQAAQKQFSKSPTGGTLQRPKNPPRYTSTSKLTSALKQDETANYAFMPGCTNKGFQPDVNGISKRELPAQPRMDHYQSGMSWKPNITESTTSNTDNYSTVEASQV